MEYVKFMYHKFLELMFKRELKEKMKIWSILIIFFVLTGIIVTSVYILSIYFSNISNLKNTVVSFFMPLILNPLTSIFLIIFTKEYVIEKNGFSKFLREFTSNVKRWFLKLALVYALFSIILILPGLLAFISVSTGVIIITSLIYYLLGVWFWSIPYFILIKNWNKGPIKWFKQSIDLGKYTFLKSLQISLFNLFSLIIVPSFVLISILFIPFKMVVLLLILIYLIFLVFVYPFILLASLWSYIDLFMSHFKKLKIN